MAGVDLTGRRLNIVVILMAAWKVQFRRCAASRSRCGVHKYAWAHFEKVGQRAAHQTNEKDNRFSKFHRPDL